MTRMIKRVLAVALTGALLVPTIQAAEAGPRDGWRHGWHGHPHHHHHRHKPHRKHHRKHKNNDHLGPALAAGIIGLAAGAIILGSTSRPRYAAPPAHHHRPAPYPGRIHGAVTYQPWSPGWYRYCAQKFRSFDPASGTYMTYRGVRKFCW
ncbi:MAG: BA14K family protein [Roseibium sp.]|nr:BA14K family protein [Roseibium sp.]